MVKMLPVPTLKPDMFGCYTITWYEKHHDKEVIKVVSEPNTDKAYEIHETKCCQWLLQPLLSWCNQHEHLATVQMLTYAGRKEHIVMLCKIVRAFNALPSINRYQLSDMLLNKAMPLFIQTMPGKNSKYYNHSMEVGKLYASFIQKAQPDFKNLSFPKNELTF